MRAGPLTLIDPETVKAYLETHYLVEGDTPLTLRVDTPNPALRALHEASRVSSSAFLTAFNPFSQRCDDESNRRSQAALARELNERQLRFVEGVGRHPSESWPGEPSFLVLGISLQQTKALGSQYRQNAVIWAGEDAIPRLVLLR